MRPSVYKPVLTPSRIRVPTRVPRSPAARRKWAFILQAAEKIGLESAYMKWKFKMGRVRWYPGFPAIMRF